MFSCTADTDIIADHLPVLGFIMFQSFFCPSKRSKALEIRKLNQELFKEKISDPECWQGVLDCTEPNSAFETFTKTFQEKLANSTTIKTRKASRNYSFFKKPWMTGQLAALMEKRDKYRKSTLKCPYDNKLLCKYKKLRNAADREICKAKHSYYQNQYEQCKSNTNEKWNFINKVLDRKNKNETTPSHLMVDGEKISTLQEIDDTFNTHFTHVGKILAGKLQPSTDDCRSFIPKNNLTPEFGFLEVSNEITLNFIKQASSRKATGYDGISMKLIKQNQQLLAPILTHMINLVIKCSLFPDSQKIARVKPLYKKGEISDPNNFRPISILTSISKLCEKVLAFQLRHHMEFNELFCDSQFGFREKRNTTLAISRLMEKLYSNFNSSEITQGVFLDFSKAFDTIDHKILLQKLPFYNINNNACQLLKSYLSNRKQFVKIDNVSSPLQDIEMGVPQGSVLGPILFLIFINDLTKIAPMLDFILFADDTNIFSSDPMLLKTNLHLVEKWCLTNRLILNTSKTFQVIFKAPNKNTKTPENYVLDLHGEELVIKDSTKFLGIEIDSSIIFKQHISQLCKKLNFVLLIMRSIRPYVDIKTMINIYYTFFYPHLIYGLEFWGHSAGCHLNQILVLQKSALRIILKIRPRGHVSSYFKILKIMPISMLFQYRFTLLFTTCLKTGEISPIIPHFNHTRSNFTYLPLRANNSRGERSLLTTGVNLFNRYLPGRGECGLRVLREGLTGALWCEGAG